MAKGWKVGLVLIGLANAVLLIWVVAMLTIVRRDLAAMDVEANLADAGTVYSAPDWIGPVEAAANDAARSSERAAIAAEEAAEAAKQVCREVVSFGRC